MYYIEHYTAQFLRTVDHFGTGQWALLVGCVVLIGFLCMRGVGGLN